MDELFTTDKGKRLNKLSDITRKQIYDECYAYYITRESARDFLIKKPRKFITLACPVRRIRHIIEMYGSI